MSLEQFVGPALGGIIAFAIAAIGWIWQLSNRAASLEYMERRLTALEAAAQARGGRIDDIADRLARIEPMIAILVEQFRKET